MTADIVAGILAWCLSLSLEVLPGFRNLWSKVDAQYKPLIFLVACVVIALGVPLLACVGVVFVVEATCPAPITAQWVVEKLFIAYAAWAISNGTFSRVQAPLGDRIKSAG